MSSDFDWTLHWVSDYPISWTGEEQQLRITNVRFRDISYFLAISGILLLTAGRYVEMHCCRCPVNNRTPLPADATGDEVEAVLRRVLRTHRLSPRSPNIPNQEAARDGSR
jgi:hypothetical protein